MKLLRTGGLIALVLALDASAAESSTKTGPTTRAQARKEARDARAAGRLQAGDVPDYPNLKPQTIGKPLRRKPGLDRVGDPHAVEPSNVKAR